MGRGEQGELMGAMGTRIEKKGEETEGC